MELVCSILAHGTPVNQFLNWAVLSFKPSTILANQSALNQVRQLATPHRILFYFTGMDNTASVFPNPPFAHFYDFIRDLATPNMRFAVKISKIYLRSGIGI